MWGHMNRISLNSAALLYSSHLFGFSGVNNKLYVENIEIKCIEIKALIYKT